MSKGTFIMTENNFVPLELKVVANLSVDVSKDLQNKESKNIDELFYKDNEEKENKNNEEENGQTPSI